MALGAALIATALPLAARVLAGPPGALVNIRWRSPLSDADRGALEARFRLADGTPLDSHTWRYDLVDPSRERIRALVGDPSVADTHGIDRPHAALEPSAARTIRRQRFAAGEQLVAAADGGSFVLGVGCLVLLSIPLLRRARDARSFSASRSRTFDESRAASQRAVPDQDPGGVRPGLWTTALVVVAAPVVITLCLTLWQSPFAISEVIALLEDVDERPVSYFFDPNRAYYRPLSYLALSTIWHEGATLDGKLAAIKLLTVVPVLLVVGLFIWYVRPRSAIEATAGSIALAVLIGSPGFRDNLELATFDTIVGMSIGMTVWVLLNRERRPWSTPVIVACTLAAVGFKEQGLALVPLAIAAWWTRAPGAGRGMAVALFVFASAYVVFRLAWHASWLPFEQDLGVGFTEYTIEEAAARFGAFPYWVYLYSSVSTISSLLFAEPRRGVFRVVQSWVNGEVQPWHIVQVGSSVVLTSLIAWWGIGALRDARARGEWTRESRVFVCVTVVVLAAGALSFNYSRERLAGFATLYYAAAAFWAVRAFVGRTLMAGRTGFVVGGLMLTLLAAAWHARAVGTVEWARGQSWANHQEWLVMLPDRRIEYAHRTTYVRVMDSLVEQGADPAVPRTRLPGWVSRIIGE
jgi:hypothetical protein